MTARSSAVLLATALFLLHFGAAGTGAKGRRPKVLVVYSHEVTLPAIREADAGLRETIGAGGSGRVELLSEHLDLFQPGDERYLELLSDLYERKYRDGGIDLVVAVGPLALEFLVKHGESIVPGKPVVFCAVEGDAVEAIPRARNMSGASMEFDMSTLELVLDLHPDLRRIVVITGSTEFENKLRERFRAQTRPMGKDLSIEYPAGLSLDDLAAIAAALPDRSAVIFISMLLDGDGEAFVPREALSKISAASSAPVYGSFDIYAGHGIVGGHLVSFREQGRMAGEVAAKILAGEVDASQPLRVTERRRTLFDWRQLRRWGIGERDLPEGSEILFREESVFIRYGWHIGAVLAFCVIQAALMAVLFVQRRMHRRAEESLDDLREQLYHVSRVKTAGELAATLAHELNQPLMAILSNAQAAGRFLEGKNPDLEEVREILREIVEDDRRAGEVIDRLRSFLKKGHLETGTVKVNDIVREVVMLVRRDANLNGIALDLDLGGHLPAVRGDRVQLQQVVLNLIRNGAEAIRRNGGGPRRIDVSSSLGDGAGVIVSIRDYGGGIGRQQEEQLFKPFITSRQEGLGIGLSISRSIVEGHGGRIWAENHPGGGAVFSFFLPAEKEVMG